MSAGPQMLERSRQRASVLPQNAVEMRLEVFASIPPRHIAYAVPDGSCMPLASEGEVLVVTDQPRLFPVEGQWFLMQWISPPYNEWERHKVGQTVGVPREVKEGLWAYGPPCNRHGGITYCGDGFFSFDQMTDYIRGKVVGIYRPRFKEGDREH